jgi:UDP-N-acetylglucosamine 2-epimerase
MKVATVVGARPQLIKAAPVSRALRDAGHSEFLIHTGQHYDYGMSQVFFEEMGLPEPDVNLCVGSGPHGWQTGRMLALVEEILIAEKPDRVLVYGDTNSTLAGALAACKLRFPLAHVEAGLRSFNREMPEEHNRVLADHCSDLLFCPTKTAVDNLAQEGIRRNVKLVGDTMYDAVLQFTEIAAKRSTILEDLGLKPKEYLLATVHRPYNTDEPESLRRLLAAFREVGEPVVFPVHPRTRAKIAELNGTSGIKSSHGNVRMIEPVGYLDMLRLERSARLILTDSGGMQKEAYFFGVPCVTLRPETEWVETVEAGWNVLVGTDRERIVEAASNYVPPQKQPPPLFGDGSASAKIVRLLGESGVS